MLHILRDASTTLHRSNAVSSSHSHETIPVFPQHGLISDECTWRRIVVSDGKPAPRRYHSGVLYKNSLYVFGGVGPSKIPTNDLYMFDFGV
jgi:hypothetical protein